MRGPRWLLVAAMGIAVFAATGSPAAAPAAEAARVAIIDSEPDLTNWHFDPAEVTVPAGSTVVWVNTGEEEHTVTSDPGSRENFDSGYKKRGASWQRVFSRPGRFSYYCAPHPWMKGTVVVVAAATPAPTSVAARGADSVSSATAGAPPPAATSTTFPPSLAAPTTTAPAETATPAAADTTSTSAADEAPGEESEEQSAALASSGKPSGSNLARTLAIVLLPTLGGLALGARLRRSRSA